MDYKDIETFEAVGFELAKQLKNKRVRRFNKSNK